MGNGERALACGEMACMCCGRLQGGGDQGGWWLAQVGDGECGMGAVASAHGCNGRTLWRAHGKSVAVRGQARSESVAAVENGVPRACADRTWAWSASRSGGQHRRHGLTSAPHHIVPRILLPGTSHSITLSLHFGHMILVNSPKFYLHMILMNMN
jgi:hypothetical protein